MNDFRIKKSDPNIAGIFIVWISVMFVIFVMVIPKILWGA